MRGRVLITGISGFVGSALGRWLRRAGWIVTGVSRSRPAEGCCDTFVSQDLAAGPPELRETFDAVVHCAALASPWAAPRDYQAANIVALRHMLNFATSRRPARFVFISSSAVHYTFADQLGLTENSPWPATPVNTYAATKRAGEEMVKESGLPWTILRPRAVFGPGDTVVFPRILHAARRGMLPQLVRGDGVSPTIDLLFIDNLCWWIEQVLEQSVSGTYLLANGEPIETSALLADILGKLGLPPPTRRLRVEAAMQMAGVMELASKTLLNWREPPVTRFGVSSLAFSKTIDITKASRELGTPPVSLAEGLDRFVAWQLTVGPP